MTVGVQLQEVPEQWAVAVPCPGRSARCCICCRRRQDGGRTDRLAAWIDETARRYPPLTLRDPRPGRRRRDVWPLSIDGPRSRRRP